MNKLGDTFLVILCLKCCKFYYIETYNKTDLRGGDFITKKQNKDLNKNQLLGRERTLMRSLQSTQKKIDDLTEKYQVKLDKLSYQLNDTETEIKEIQDLIKEEEWITEGKRIYIVKNDKTIRGKVQYRNKMRWFHIGQTESLKDKTDDELKEMVRKKFYQSLITKPK